MPKRSNSFQQLIYAIQHSISCDSIVTESKFLVDRQTGNNVEVDIVIDVVVNDIPLIVSIEVRDRKRPATVEWVRESIGKHSTLPTNKLVLVSSSGFTKEASKKANENGIEVLSLEEAEHYSWSKAIQSFTEGDMKLAVFNLSLVNYSVSYTTILNGDKEVSIESESLNDCVFSNSSNGESGTILNLACSLLKDGKVARPVMKQWIENDKEDFVVTWNVPKGSTITDTYGNCFTLDSIKVFGKCSVEKESIDFQSSKFKDTYVAHATAKDILSKPASGGEVTLTLIEQNGKPPKSTITLPKPDESGRRVLIMESGESPET